MKTCFDIPEQVFFLHFFIFRSIPKSFPIIKKADFKLKKNPCLQ